MADSDSASRETMRPAPRGGEAVAFLRQSLERVDREREGLMRVAASLDEFVHTQEARYAELEHELNDTALLYVASYQLQARLEPAEVLRHVRELLEQLVGVETFVLYLANAQGRGRAVSTRGVKREEVPEVRLDEGAFAAAFAQQAPYVEEGAQVGSLSRPLAVVPLLLRERVVGAISIVKLFPHKATWAAVDLQLLNLLTSHAAPALLAAHMVRLAEQQDLWGTLANLGAGLE